MLTEKKTGRRLSLGMQIIAFSSLFLLALPWLGYRYMDEMKEFLVKGQGDAQLLAAQAIASVLHNRSDLFDVSAVPSSALVEESSLYVYPLDAGIVVDGYGSDWESLLSQKKQFGPESLVYDRTAGAASPISFGLLLGEHNRYLYGLISVTDRTVVYRHPGYARLDSSDQARIELINPQGETRRYSILAEAPGDASVYQMDADWARPTTGKPIYALHAVWQDKSHGYDIEFRLPIKWLNHDKQLMISIADVNSSTERKVDAVVATLSADNTGYLNKLITRSPELDRIIKGLSYTNATVCIVDQYRRVRAVLANAASQSELCSLTDKVAADMVAKAIAGESNVHRTADDTNEVLVIASHPVYQGTEIIGAVLVEKNSRNILAQQRSSLYKIIVATAIVFTAALIGLLLFSSLLAYRIRKLQREVSGAIDPDGRLITDVIAASKYAGDEVGELSRGFSLLLSQLKSYTGFLESVPRTLRHEILNPLNTISMTLQKLSTAQGNDAKLVDSARNALRQLELIVHSLTEAAHIEDALAQDEKTSFDFAELLTEYISNIQLKHPHSVFTYSGPASGITLQGSDLRITQMLDKLKDNAIDFATAGTAIDFQLHVDNKQQTMLSICNKGPLIPDELILHLCNGISSSRQGTSGEPHLGIGLYVASRIAKHHHGSLRIFNTDDKHGVCVLVQLPALNA